MRPVESYVFADWATKELDNRDSQGLRLDVDHGKLESGNSLGCDTAGTLPGAPDHIPEAHFIGAGILSNEAALEVGNRARYPVRAAALAALPPACNPLVRLNRGRMHRGVQFLRTIQII